MAGTKKKMITIDNWTWGIGSDKYLSVQNGCYDWEWLDIRRWKRVILNTHNTKNIVSFGDSNIKYMDSTKYLSDDWYIYSPTANKLYKFASSDDNLSNAISFNIAWTEYNLLFAWDKIHRYAWSITTKQLTSYSATWWSWDENLFINNYWNTWAITSSAPLLTTERYRIVIRLNSISATWTLTFKIGWVTIDTYTSANVSSNYTYFVTPSVAWVITFTPTADYTWWISLTSYYPLDNNLSVCNVEEDWRRLPNSTNLHPVLVRNGFAYIGNWDKLLMLSNLWLLETKFTIEAWYEIVSLTLQDSYLILWTRNGQWSKLLFWDFISANPTRTIHRYNEIIQNVISQNNYHLVLTWGDYWIKKIWKSNWYTRSMMYQIPEGWRWIWGDELYWVPPIPLAYWGISNNIYINNVESFWDLTFLPWYHKILTYGKRIPWFPDAMFCDYTIDAWRVTAMYVSDWQLNIAYSWDQVYGNYVQTFKIDNYETIPEDDNYYFWARWYISMNPIVFLASKQKSWLRLTLWYKTPTNTFMSLYYRLDWEVNRYTFVVDEIVHNIITLPTVWSTYAYGSTYYEVTKVTNYKYYTLIEVICTYLSHQPRRWCSLTKTSWIGDNTIVTTDFHNYRHRDIFDSTMIESPRCYETLFNESFYEVQFRVELFTRDGGVSPELNDFSLLYEEISDD